MKSVFRPQKSIDKSAWLDGPWKSEPDRVEFTHAGFPCLLLRHETFGSFCGYVALPVNHPWAKLADFDEIPAEVHGGCTYGPRECNARICHVPAPGESDDVRWIGFDANHLEDMAPAMDGLSGPRSPFRSIQYRTVSYMSEECKRLAEQAQAVQEAFHA